MSGSKNGLSVLERCRIYKGDRISKALERAKPPAVLFARCRQSYPIVEGLGMDRSLRSGPKETDSSKDPSADKTKP